MDRNAAARGNHDLADIFHCGDTAIGADNVGFSVLFQKSCARTCVVAFKGFNNIGKR
jgi:hypothetical protein